jgi:hypothetical protein
VNLYYEATLSLVRNRVFDLMSDRLAVPVYADEGKTVCGWQKVLMLPRINVLLGASTANRPCLMDLHIYYLESPTHQDMREVVDADWYERETHFNRIHAYIPGHWEKVIGL